MAPYSSWIRCISFMCSATFEEKKNEAANCFHEGPEAGPGFLLNILSLPRFQVMEGQNCAFSNAENTQLSPSMTNKTRNKEWPVTIAQS